jgi:hypothetical protein
LELNMQKRSNERDLSIQQGLKTYNGKSCKKCNTSEKYVSSYSCVKCNIEKNSHKLFNNELMKSYRTKKKQIKDCLFGEIKIKIKLQNNIKEDDC